MLIVFVEENVLCNNQLSIVGNRRLRSWWKGFLLITYQSMQSCTSKSISQFDAGDLVLVRRSDGALRYGEIISAANEPLQDCLEVCNT